MKDNKDDFDIIYKNINESYFDNVNPDDINQSDIDQFNIERFPYVFYVRITYDSMRDIYEENLSSKYKSYFTENWEETYDNIMYLIEESPLMDREAELKFVKVSSKAGFNRASYADENSQEFTDDAEKMFDIIKKQRILMITVQCEGTLRYQRDDISMNRQLGQLGHDIAKQLAAIGFSNVDYRTFIEYYNKDIRSIVKPTFALIPGSIFKRMKPYDKSIYGVTSTDNFNLSKANCTAIEIPIMDEVSFNPDDIWNHVVIENGTDDKGNVKYQHALTKGVCLFPIKRGNSIVLGFQSFLQVHLVQYENIRMSVEGEYALKRHADHIKESLNDIFTNQKDKLVTKAYATMINGTLYGFIFTNIIMNFGTEYYIVAINVNTKISTFDMTASERNRIELIKTELGKMTGNPKLAKNAISDLVKQNVRHK